MQKSYRYEIKRVDGEYCVVDNDTGQSYRPSCIQDLVSYYTYHRQRFGDEAAQQLLAEVAAGGKPITRLIIDAREKPAAIQDRYCHKLACF